MKVLMLAPSFVIHSKRPLNWLLASRCEVTYVDYGDPNPDQRERYHFIPYPLPRGKRYYEWLGYRISKRISDWTVYSRLRKLGRQVRPDLVHLHWVDERAYHCAKAGLRPLVLTVWGMDINECFLPDADPDRCRRTGEALAAADVIIADAADMEEKCSRLAGRKVHTELLPIGIDTKKFRPGYGDAAREWRRKLAIPDKTKVFFSIRAIGRQYQHHLILEAFAKAFPHFRSQAVLIFIAYNRVSYPDATSYEEELRSRADVLGVAQSVRWMDEVPHEQLPDLFALADAIVNYPFQDAFPVTFLMAAACKRPVITVRLPSYEGTFAEALFRLVPPDNVAGLADAMIEFVNDGADKWRLNLCAARKAVTQQYDESITIQRLLEIYRNLVT